MFWNFLKISFRNILRQKFYYFINVTGLALGFTSSILIVLFVLDEYSYDRFHKNADRIYRITASGVIGGTKINQTFTSAPVPRALMNDFPEVESVVRIFDAENIEVRYEEVSFIENNVILADSNFFRIFTFPLLRGNPDKALSGPNMMLISESTAHRYFGSPEAVGKRMKIQNGMEFEITGVYKDVPPNSHFHFDFIGSLTTLDMSRNEDWMNNNFKTYLLLKPGTDPNTLQSKFPEFIRKYIWPEENIMKDFKEAGNSWEYSLQPLTWIHLHSDLNGEFEANGNSKYIFIFLFSAGFIILIAAVNFTNLSTAKSEKRSREVGIRKVVGSSRLMLILQFLSESVFMSLLALLIGMILVSLVLPSFNTISGKSLILSNLLHPVFIMGILLLSILIGLLSGIYPGFFLSSFQPVQVLKSGPSPAGKRSNLRGVLVIFQFFISVTLIISTLVVYRQVQFFQNTELGFNKEHVLVIHGTDKLTTQYPVFRDHLRSYHAVKNISGSLMVPGSGFYNWGMLPEGEDEEWFTLNSIICDTAFLDTYQMTMSEGRFFSPEYPSDSTAIIINENAAKLLGWEDAVGKKIKLWGQLPYEVIGVIGDFHYESLHQLVRPLALFQLPMMEQGSRYPSLTSVKISGENLQETIRFIEEQWNNKKTGLPFHYTFFDKDYGKLYENEKQIARVLLIFSILAIIIASMGLLALSFFMIEKRTREIGIRKVNGASVNDIILLMGNNFTRLVIAGILLAVPVSYLVMKNWLQNFPYRTNLPVWIFIFAAIMAFIVAVLAIGFQTIKASKQNPALSLRYE